MAPDLNPVSREAYDHLLDLMIQEISAYGWVYKIMNRPSALRKGEAETARVLKRAAELTRKRKAATALLYAALIPGRGEATLGELIALLPRKEQQVWNRFRERLRLTYDKAMESYKQSAADEDVWRQFAIRPRTTRARTAVTEG